MTTIREPSKSYVERLEALVSVVAQCGAISRASAGIPAPSGAHYWASVLFTSLCTRATSLVMLLPYSRWSKKEFEHWDFSSAAGIVRSILEVRLAFFYLAVEKCSADEWRCRQELFNLKDCNSRIRFFQEMKGDHRPQIEHFEKEKLVLHERLQKNSYFSVLPEKDRNRLLKGQTAYLSPLEEIATRAGIADIETFRWLYHLLSNEVHGLPMSFYRMGEQNRGRGVHSESEEHYTRLCMSFSLTMLTRSRDEMKVLFPVAGGV